MRTEGLRKPLLTGRGGQGPGEPQRAVLGAGERSPRQDLAPEFSLETGPDTVDPQETSAVGGLWLFLFLGGWGSERGRQELAGGTPCSLTVTHCPLSASTAPLRRMATSSSPSWGHRSVPYLKARLASNSTFEHVPRCRSHKTWTSCLRPLWSRLPRGLFVNLVSV